MIFDFIAIDFETANNNNDSACSLGIACVSDNQIIEEKYYLIQPSDMKFDKKNISINKITSDDVKNAPLFSELWNKIKHYFDGNTIIVAHNAVFDMSVLKNCLIKYDLEIPDFNYVCSIPISNRVCGSKLSASLEARTQYFGISIGNHHNSLDDAKACANLVIACLKSKKRKSLTSYCNMYKSISIKNFKDLNPLKQLKKEHRHFDKIILSEIKPDVDFIDNHNKLYGKNIVFTGELETMPRKEAMQKVVNLGAILKSSVSSKTNYLIVGIQDKTLVGADGMSSKEEKAYKLIDQGYGINILNGTDFLKLIELDNRNNSDTISSYEDAINSMINFNNIDEKIAKLKEWQLLSPKSEELKDIYYKDNDCSYKCEVVGYLSKKTNSKCISETYETVILMVNDKLIKINPVYLSDMQKKNFSFSYIVQD